MIYRLILISIVALSSISPLSAQREHYTSDTSLSEQIKLIKEKHDKFNLYLNTQFGTDITWQSGEFQRMKFNGRQLRIEAKGHLNEKVSYRLLQRLNTTTDATGAFDNLPGAIDVAGIGLELSEKFSLFLGKQCTAYGGVEFDFNPIVVYEFADMIEHSPSFMTGINLIFRPIDTQKFQLQLLNARTRSLSETYPQASEVTLKDTKLPLLGTINWTGKVTDFWNAMWSYSYMTQTADHAQHYIALGNELRFGSISGYFDAMYSHEGLNAKPLIPIAENAEYLSFIAKLSTRIHPMWNIFVKGMYETAYDAGEGWFKGKLMRSSFGYFAGVEYYPYKENLRFFLSYIRRAYVHNFNSNLDYNTDRIALGFIYQLPIF